MKHLSVVEALVVSFLFIYVCGSFTVWDWLHFSTLDNYTRFFIFVFWLWIAGVYYGIRKGHFG